MGYHPLQTVQYHLVGRLKGTAHIHAIGFLVEDTDSAALLQLQQRGGLYLCLTEDELDRIAAGQLESVPWLHGFYFGPDDGNGGVVTETFDLTVDNVAPEFTGTDVSGDEHALADSRGGVVVLDFWATWCSPPLMRPGGARQAACSSPASSWAPH